MGPISRRKFLTTSSLAVAGTFFFSCAVEDLRKIGQTPHTKFAVNVEMWWKNLPFIERIRQTASLGFPAIEFWGYEKKDLAAIKQTCDELGVVITQFTAWGFKPGMNNPENHDLFEKKIKEACQVAKRLGCKLATVVGGDDQPGMTQEEMHENIIIALKRVAPIAEDHDLTLILEPMNIRVVLMLKLIGTSITCKSAKVIFAVICEKVLTSLVMSKLPIIPEDTNQVPEKFIIPAF